MATPMAISQNVTIKYKSNTLTINDYDYNDLWEPSSVVTLPDQQPRSHIATSAFPQKWPGQGERPHQKHCCAIVFFAQNWDDTVVVLTEMYTNIYIHGCYIHYTCVYIYIYIWYFNKWYHMAMTQNDWHPILSTTLNVLGPKVVPQKWRHSIHAYIKLCRCRGPSVKLQEMYGNVGIQWPLAAKRLQNLHIPVVKTRTGKLQATCNDPIRIAWSVGF